MKITKAQLKQIIKEELVTLSENKKLLSENLENLMEITETAVSRLEDNIYHLSGYNQMVFKEGAKEELEGLILNFLIDNTDYSEKDLYEPDETDEEPLRLSAPEPGSTERMRQGLRRQQRPRSPGDFRSTKDRWEV